MKILCTFLLLFSFSINAGIDSWWNNRQAVQAFKSGNYDESLSIYNNLIDNDPYNATYNYNIGDVLYRLNRYEDAKQAFKRSVTHAQKNLKLAEYALYGAGNSSYQLKEWQQAIDMYEEALKLNGNNEQARHNLKLAQEKLMEERLKEMQDKLEKNKDNKDKDKQDKEKQSGDDQQDQSGNDSQDSSGSSSENQSPGDKNKNKQTGKQEQPEKGQKSQDEKDSGDEKHNDAGDDDIDDQESKNKKDQQLSKDGKSGEPQESGQSDENNGKDASGKQDIYKKNEDTVSSDNGENHDAPSEMQERDFDEKLKDNQQKLDDAASQAADQEQQAEKQKKADEQTIQDAGKQTEKQQESVELKDEQACAGAKQDAKGLTSMHKKPELKNQLQDLYEAKSSDDERLDSYYADIMKALEGQEEYIQRHIIKNRVAEKMVGQHGKNGW